MATILKNLSAYDTKRVPKAKDMRFGIVVSEWNEEITKALCLGAVETLMYHKVKAKNITVKYVPGSFELTLGAQFLLDYTDVDAVICLGCVIQGETRHFDFICDAVSNGIMKLTTDYATPVVFGVLTTNSYEQAKDRSGGKHGNKGTEAAITAIKMVALQKELISKYNPS
ncbi:MAG: 6,7-dimethyl-8-ribityllumazine synthase [Bacteroidetes bacterium]|nr:6,7-dimethyl-8-ribityllumazine synthase [Bacteroidota bacterium]